jgi:large subunit ribosomal protein L15
MKVHDLKPAEGSRKARKRVGRGIGGKGGKTAGRGTKGQAARGSIPASFEGGQMPLHMRIPKLKGFNNPFRVEYQAINLDTLEECGLDEISPETLLGKGLVGKSALVKVLGRGELTRSVTVKAHGFSKSAEAAITAAGGTVERLPLPWGEGRPPAKGNQFTNR